MMRILDYLFAGRPLLHLPLWTIYLVTLHYHQRISGDRFSIIDLVLMACLSMLFAGAYYLNQVYDAESDRINNKLGFLQRGFLTEKAMVTLFLLLSVGAILIGSFISNPSAIIFLLIFVLSYAYSTPPFRLKDRAFGGLFANAVAYGFLVSMAVMPDMNINNIGLLGWDNPIYFTLTVGAIYCITTVPDIEGDAAVGKRTVAVVWGRRPALIVGLVLMLLSVLVAYHSGYLVLAILSALGSLLIIPAIFSRSEKPVLLAAKLPILLLTLLAGYFFPIYFLFIVALLIATRIYYRKRFDVIYPRLA